MTEYIPISLRAERREKKVTIPQFPHVYGTQKGVIVVTSNRRISISDAIAMAIRGTGNCYMVPLRP